MTTTHDIDREQQLETLLAPLAGIPLFDDQRRALDWLAGGEPRLVNAIAELFQGCREKNPLPVEPDPNETEAQQMARIQAELGEVSARIERIYDELEVAR